MNPLLSVLYVALLACIWMTDRAWWTGAVFVLLWAHGVVRGRLLREEREEWLELVIRERRGGSDAPRVVLNPDETTKR